MTRDTAKPDSCLPDPPETWGLKLFVAGQGVRTQQVRRRLESICEEYLADQCHIDMVDILETPEQAYAFDIIATPTLLRQSPQPVRKIIGDLSDTERVLAGLEILPHSPNR